MAFHAIGVPTATAETHVRPTFSRARSAIERGTQKSATFVALVDTINRSNIIVHIVDGDCRNPHTRACTSFVAASPDVRYVRITIAQFLPADGIIVVLAHELQHVAEIAGVPDVVDDRGMAAFFEAFGWSATDGSFETRRAMDASARVARELASGAALRKRFLR